MAAFEKSDRELFEKEIQRIMDALARAGLGMVKMADLVAAMVLNALKASDGDRDRAAASLGISRQELDLNLDHCDGLAD